MSGKEGLKPIEGVKAGWLAPKCHGNDCEYVGYKETEGRLLFWCSKVNEEVFDIQDCPIEKWFKDDERRPIEKLFKDDKGRPIMNIAQKVIIGFSVGLLLFTITLVLTKSLTWGVGAFGFRRVWLLWLPFIVVVGYFEYKLFSKGN